MIDSAMLLYSFLILLTLNLVIELGLAILNLGHLKKYKELPEYFQDYINKETYQKSCDYTEVKEKFSIFTILYSSIWLVLFMLCGWFGDLDELVGSLSLNGIWRGIGVIFLISACFSLIGLPLELYSTFVIEEKFGFNKMTVKLWLIDKLKGLAIGMVIFMPLLYGLLWFMEASGSLWWVYAFSFLAGFQLLLMFIYPVWIMPLFNKFSELAEGELKERIWQLTKKVNYLLAGIFEMDGSKRSGHSNAFFTGFGKNKRIVLFDTLIQSLSTDEIVSVLAHEIGHQKLGHIKKMIALSLFMTLVGFWILSLLVDYQPLFQAFGFNHVSNYGALVVFMFATSPITYFFTPLFSIFSRKHEYEADAFAKDAVETGEHLASALKSLSKENLSNLVPHPWYSFFHYSHPTLGERLSKLRELDE